MELKSEEKLMLLSHDELQLRLGRVAEAMEDTGLRYLLIGDNANLYYLTGRVFCGYVLVGAEHTIKCFLRRPSSLAADGITTYHKLEDMLAEVKKTTGSAAVGLTLDDVPYSTIMRIHKGLGEDITIGNASAILRKARAVKTPAEIKALEISGTKQTQVYREIPRLFQEGMSDVEFQIEIERALRLAGCLGQFRCTGAEMEIFMGNVLTGENADTPSPYDFAMGGAGMDPSLPVGANGTIIHPGNPIMVDMNGNFTGYMTDMTRCYVEGEAPQEAVKANSLSAAICEAIANAARPGVAAKDLYGIAMEMVEEAGMERFFMGHRHQAGFVGHGVGISINELPVIAPRSRDILKAGNAIALEPKFVIPGIGAIGVENTYIVEPDGPARRITLAPEEIQQLK